MQGPEEPVAYGTEPDGRRRARRRDRIVPTPKEHVAHSFAPHGRRQAKPGTATC